jgi:transcription antitermination factor NusG
MDGEHPAHVPDRVLDGIRERERNGIVVLPRQGPQPGDQVRVVRGPFTGHLAIYAGMPGPERVAVLLTFLGGPHRVSLPREDVEPV